MEDKNRVIAIAIKYLNSNIDSQHILMSSLYYLNDIKEVDAGI